MSEFFAVFRRDDFLNQLLVHVELSVVALLIGVVISMPIALATFRSPFWAAVAINTGNIGRAVPSLAILALVFPLLGFGFTPSLVALTLLAIPPILINASTGLSQVNPQVIDAARGMGLSNGQILTGIQLPIAAPVIFAGIRTSAVQVVASATLATFVGGGGLGAVVGHIVGGYGPSLFGRRVDDLTATQAVIAGCILGTVLGAVRGHRVACITLLAFEVHWGEEDEEPPERPWRGWS